eukprot:TRINITY_DN1455_c0_g2_i3.p1 TRINITY_DN1455_c0_g2~~TRINITY_DN1455_c0_g2_i3.p1  ORF type:complete len:569 (-),score=108.22 TRINITY_DN1455_c0_g2_i3:40-1746(-)
MCLFMFCINWGHVLFFFFFFFFKQKTAYEMQRGLVGSEMCIRDRYQRRVHGDVMSYTSDHFPKLFEYMDKMIKDGLAYADNIPAEEMKIQRGAGIESPNRANSVEENIQHWQEMISGSPEGQKWCIRAKIDMKHKVKCLRDPVMYRCNLIPHHRTGTTYKVYPCYDFCCPIVDSLEGVTHAMRTIEYRDRNHMYKWIQEKTGVRPVIIQDFSRLCLVNTVMSKRKLQYFVDKGLVEGWNDPRFPTVQGIMRRGLTIRAITEFMLEQGASQNNNLMEWGQLWAMNKKVIDPISPRYSAISKEGACRIVLENGPETSEAKEVGLHQKNESLGNKNMWFSKTIIIEKDDAKLITENEKITLYRWMNCLITSIKEEDGQLVLTGKLLPDDKDFKSTKKVTWISYDPKLILNCRSIEFGHLITKPSLDEGDEVDDFINPNSKVETMLFGEIDMTKLTKGNIIQIERRGFYYVDSPFTPESNSVTLHYIPDGAQKSMSKITSKIDPKATSKGEGHELSKKKKKKEAKKKEAKKTEKKVDGEKEETKETEKKGAEAKEEQKVQYSSNLNLSLIHI